MPVWQPPSWPGCWPRSVRLSWAPSSRSPAPLPCRNRERPPARHDLITSGCMPRLGPGASDNLGEMPPSLLVSLALLLGLFLGPLGVYAYALDRLGRQLPALAAGSASLLALMWLGLGLARSAI